MANLFEFFFRTHWKGFSILLFVIIALSVGLGLYYGLRKPDPPPHATPAHLPGLPTRIAGDQSPTSVSAIQKINRAGLYIMEVEIAAPHNDRPTGIVVPPAQPDSYLIYWQSPKSTNPALQLIDAVLPLSTVSANSVPLQTVLIADGYTLPIKPNTVLGKIWVRASYNGRLSLPVGTNLISV